MILLNTLEAHKVMDTGEPFIGLQAVVHANVSCKAFALWRADGPNIQGTMVYQGPH